jgi:uncharacterized protein (UPF0147 family)
MELKEQIRNTINVLTKLLERLENDGVPHNLQKRKTKKQQQYDTENEFTNVLNSKRIKKVEDECELLRRRILNQEEYEYYLERKNKPQQAI